MANFKFFNIGQANAEIERLDTENKRLAGELAGTQENAKAVEASATEAQSKIKQAEADVTTARQTISSMTSQIATAQADLAKAAKERDDAKAIIEKPDGEIARRASVKAAEITAAQGQPPIASAPAANPAAPAKPAMTGLAKVEAAFAAQLTNSK